MCCDANIFKFLLDYCTELHQTGKVREAKLNKLENKLLVPVLVSSVFLQIEPLIEEWVDFWEVNFEKIMLNEKIP